MKLNQRMMIQLMHQAQSPHCDITANGCVTWSESHTLMQAGATIGGWTCLANSPATALLAISTCMAGYICCAGSMMEVLDFSVLC
jgi:hypothetical protein